MLVVFGGLTIRSCGGPVSSMRSNQLIFLDLASEG
jgi:hypothetical protein